MGELANNGSRILRGTERAERDQERVWGWVRSDTEGRRESGKGTGNKTEGDG